MEVKQSDLDAWAMRALHVNGCLLQALTAIQKGDLASAQHWAELAREENWTTEKAIVAAGAANPIQVLQDEMADELPEEDRPLPPAPEGYDLAALELGTGGTGAGE